MAKKYLLIALITGITGLPGCKNQPNEKIEQIQNAGSEMKMKEEDLIKILDAFNRHDLDDIMAFFSEDCSFDFPRGPQPWGQRFTGKAQVREALAGRFKGIPDVHYGDDIHWISENGSRGVSEWTLTGTTISGNSLCVRGCDLWEFRNGKVIRKDSYWKIVEPAAN